MIRSFESRVYGIGSTGAFANLCIMNSKWIAATVALMFGIVGAGAAVPDAFWRISKRPLWLRKGWTFRRDFEHAMVFVDLEKREGTIQWLEK